MKKATLTVIVIIIGAVIIMNLDVYGQPIERVPASSHGVYDMMSNRIEFVKVGQQINIKADLANAQDVEQSIAYTVVIYDSKRNIVHRGSIEGVLAPKMAFSPAISWIPEKIGYYKAEIFVWPSIDNPTALSPVLESEFYVIRNFVGIHLECKKGYLYTVKINEEIPKNYCIKPKTKVEIILRGWAVDDREITGPAGADTSLLYPKDKIVYRKLLEKYYLGKDSDNELTSIPPEKLNGSETKLKPSTIIEISFGKAMTRKFLPVVFSEITTNAENLDKITVWNFELIGHSGDDRRIIWDIVPRDTGIFYEITDDNGQDIIDHTRMPENWAIPSDQHVYNMDCGVFHTVTGESAHPSSFPIKNNTYTINAKNSWMGIYPNSDSEYSFEFASIFETSVKLPEGAKIISQESKHCKLTHNIEDDSEGKYTDGYYTKMIFRLK